MNAVYSVGTTINLVLRLPYVELNTPSIITDGITISSISIGSEISSASISNCMAVSLGFSKSSICFTKYLVDLHIVYYMVLLIRVFI